MQFLDLSFPNPAHNLACDEALLESAATGESGAILRFWESPTYFVTLGYTNKAALEANLPACAAQKIPVLRRCSGGGTVLQGPGCLNYALIHPIEIGQALNVGATNDFVMETNRRAFETALKVRVELAGHTDLAIEGRKFSGNAQKRKTDWFLFHGTILLDFDLERVQTLLLPPPKEPNYRARRSHLEFIRNIPLGREAVKSALAQAWNATQKTELWPRERVETLVAQKYARDEWNLKF
ncbi:lipoate-protein ligase A [Abditibacterium utsteinense]|uniref:Lipoate-protein ligase A n=1 Tax=Abditibacterium utsteinense TaxID=1960156 RepID=A0A2S8STH1_9BACT|nr:lipoate--protein ligase family protein [Abditibacterium utsteinense]PQV64101.1 lipoate-protein ligase A [Abditibacterium utsteinense]